MRSREDADLRQHLIKQLCLEPLLGPPHKPQELRIYFDRAIQALRYWHASQWNNLATQEYVADLLAPTRHAAINYVIGNGRSVILTGSKGYLVVEFDCTIDSWMVVADQVGNISVDVLRANYADYPATVSLSGSGTPIHLSGTLKNQASPTDWDQTSLSAGDILEFTVDTVVTVQRVTVALGVTKL